VDPLADVLDLSRVQGAVMATVQAKAPWGLDLAQSDGASFHAITSGTAWLALEGQEPVQLMPGDLVLLPSGLPHQVASDPVARCLPFDRRMKQQQMTPAGDLLLGGAGAATTFVCASYSYDLEAAEWLMSLLPPVLHVPADPVSGRDVAAVVELLAAEVGRRDAGARSAASRLVELLFISAVRRWADTQGDDVPSWLKALRDPLIGEVLALLHDDPAHPWTLDEVAGRVHVSRATLARRFSEAVGESPLGYLSRWRMTLAAQRLKHSADSVEAIAHSVGYRSEYAFNRAFSRHQGRPPGRYRRAVQTAA
jgi:AraC-like DNA-binding protein